MNTRPKRQHTSSVWTCCLLLLTLVPVSASAQKPTAADVPTLVKELKDKKALVRADAARRLVLLGQDAKPALPDLIEALSDTDDKVRHRALMALGNLWFLRGRDSGDTATAPFIPRR